MAFVAMLLGLLIFVPTVLTCPAPGVSDQEILKDNPHLRELFARYSEGAGVITPEGLQKLLKSLGVDVDPHPHEHHAGDDHVTHDHHPQDHKCGTHLGDDHAHSGDDPKHAAVDNKDAWNDHGRSNHLGDDHSNSKDHAEHDDGNHHAHHNERPYPINSNRRNDRQRRDALLTTLSPPLHGGAHLHDTHDHHEDELIRGGEGDQEHTAHKPNTTEVSRNAAPGLPTSTIISQATLQKPAKVSLHTLLYVSLLRYLYR
ncbi:zinc transporter ZIP6-like [Procambarus clarkii]|uniref:zinc transporter ZIP6-like n=1 Tax=Procambarus clarkii TaxID=6728 RepID=UPI003743DBA6